MFNSSQTRRNGFTLVELLVVIAIIGILIGMLLPAVQQVREAARRSACSNNVRQLSLAAMNYESARMSFPSGYTQEFVTGQGSNNGFSGNSVFYYVLPFMEQNNLYDTMNALVPKSSIATSVADGKAGAVVQTLLCPSDPLPSEPIPYPSTGTPSQFYGGTSYRANAGSRPFFATSSSNDGVFMAVGSAARKASSADVGFNVNIGAVFDGLSNTILFGEFAHDDPNFDTFTAAGWNSGSTIVGWSRWYPAGGDNGLGNLLAGGFAPINFRIPWAHGQPGAPTSQSAWFTIQDQRLSSYGSNHAGGANLAFGDGSVRFLTNGMSQNILLLYCQRADGQVISSE